MKKIVLAALAALLSVTALAQPKEYKASLFGIKSNGVIDNTASIQRAIDIISAKGGGTLVFNVGRYVTGAVQLRSGVNIKINEGAVIVGSTNYYCYRGQKAIFYAVGEKGITISGRGVIDGLGAELLQNMQGYQAKGLVPADAAVPSLLYFEDCKDIVLKDFIFRNPATKELYLNSGSSVKEDGCYCDTAL